MNIFVWLNSVVLVLAITDFVFPNQKRFNQQIFNIAWFLSFFVFAIKYYFGPDIVFYSELYDATPSNSLISLDWLKKANCEYGYAIYCNILKYFGASLWLTTFIITALYFAAIYQLFKHIQNYRTFALFVIIVLDYNLLVCEFRQCMAVSLFIFALLCFIKKRHVAAVLLVTIAAFMHKSALFATAAFVCVLIFQRLRFTKLTYGILLILLLALTILPIEEIANFFTSLLPLTPATVKSIEHHISVSIQFQSVFLVYAALFLCLAFQKMPTFDRSWKSILLITIIGSVIIVFFYRNWLLLNRLRSYFLPFILVYCIHIFGKQRDGNRLLRQGLAAITLFYCIVWGYAYKKGLELEENKVSETSTIFARLNKSEEQIKAENMEKAKLFWANYNKYLTNDK